MGFGARLKEERKRLGLMQAEFAARVGSDMPKQSMYENDRRALRAAYLARAAAAGVDVLYVLTGRRSEGASGEGVSELLAAFLSLKPEVREVVARLVADLGGLSEQRRDRG